MNVSQFQDNPVGCAQLSPILHAVLHSSAASCGQSFWVPLSTQTCFLGVRFYTRSFASFHGEHIAGCKEHLSQLSLAVQEERGSFGMQDLHGCWIGAGHSWHHALGWVQSLLLQIWVEITLWN